MRRISIYDAAQCAAAAQDICNCRCGGILHGKKHKKLIEYEDSLSEKGEEITQLKVTRFINRKKVE